MDLGIPDKKHKQFYKSNYFNIILRIFKMPANNRKDIFLKHNREKGKNTLKR